MKNIESNQEGYLTLGWILNKSEQGLFLAVADEATQREIARVYKRGSLEIYNCREHFGEYSFQSLEKWIDQFPDIQTFFILNFHLAIQDEQDLGRLNFSRDMLAGMGKNLIFFTTPYGDDRLANGAYDFYSFLKIRVIFPNRESTYSAEQERSSEENLFLKEKEDPKGARQKLYESYDMFRRAEEAYDKGCYKESENLLLQAGNIRKRLLGEHPETAVIYATLSRVYEEQGRYQEAEKQCQNTLAIRQKILGQSHPDTAKSYQQMAGLYIEQGRYREAKEAYQIALTILICKDVLGEEHPSTAVSYNNLATLYEEQGKCQEAEKLYRKALSICEKVLGKEHQYTVDILRNLNNLTDRSKE